MKKALVLCGGYPQLEMIKQLQARGIMAYLADMNPKAPAVPYADKFFEVSTLDVDGIRNVVKQEGIDMLLTTCADQMPLVTSQISEELGLPTYISYETAKIVSSKELMKATFVKGGVPTSKHTILATLNLEDIEGFEFPLIVKPVDAYSSKGVRKCMNYEELVPAFNEAVTISRTDTAVVEEYVGGEEYTVDVYVEDGVAKVLSIGVLDKIPEKGKFVICRGRYPSGINDKVKADIADTAQKIANAFNLVNTPMLIQLKVENDKVSVIEFCARTGGGIKYRLVKQISGFDPVAAIIDLTLGNKPHVEDFVDDNYIVNEFVYANEGELDHIEGLEELLAEGVIDHYLTFKPKGYKFGEIKSSGDRAAYFSVSAKSAKELKDKHEIAKNQVKVMSVDGKDLAHHDYMVLP